MTSKKESIVFGGGCFWCTEAGFKLLKGVSKVTSGYAGGEADSANYEAVSSGTTNHAEVVKIEYDPDVISLAQLLEVFFTIHDPTTLNRQGPDVGTQYRSVIFTTTHSQKQTVRQKISAIQKSLEPEKRVVTQLESLGNFFAAESYHQDYFDKNPDVPYCSLLVAPKVEKIRKLFPQLLKD